MSLGYIFYMLMTAFKPQSETATGRHLFLSPAPGGDNNSHHTQSPHQRGPVPVTSPAVEDRRSAVDILTAGCVGKQQPGLSARVMPDGSPGSEKDSTEEVVLGVVPPPD